LIRKHLDKGETGVLASSALKRRYRDKLRVDDRVQFIFLDGDFDLIWGRMQARQDHYMKAEMLQSQFNALEVPDEDEAITIPIDRSVEEIVAQTIAALQKNKITD
jgi:gluconokinase